MSNSLMKYSFRHHPVTFGSLCCEPEPSKLGGCWFVRLGEVLELGVRSPNVSVLLVSFVPFLCFFVFFCVFCASFVPFFILKS